MDMNKLVNEFVCLNQTEKEKRIKKIQTKKDQLNREDEKGYPDALGKWFDKKENNKLIE